MLTITIPGQPQGKGRARAFKTKAGRIGHYTPDKTRTYEGLIRTQALEAMNGAQPTQSPVSLVLDLQYQIPTSWPAWKQEAARSDDIAPTVKPDADNVAKAVKDALNGVVWLDDCQVVAVTIIKRYSNYPAVGVSVNEMEGIAPAQIKSKKDLAA